MPKFTLIFHFNPILMIAIGYLVIQMKPKKQYSSMRKRFRFQSSCHPSQFAHFIKVQFTERQNYMIFHSYRPHLGDVHRTHSGLWPAKSNDR